MSRSKRHDIERVELSAAEIDALLNKAAAALSPDEVDKLRRLVATLQYITNELDKKRVSVKRLQQMLFGSSSEKKSSPRLQDLVKKAAEVQKQLGMHERQGDEAAAENATSNTDEADASEGEAPRGHGRRGAAAYSGGEHIHISHPTLQSKDPCPKCPKGKLYQQKRPKVIVRLTGSAPIQAKVWSYDWFRCNLCGYIVNTPLPPEVGPPQTYDESVTSAIGVLRYGFGMPFNRLANLQESVNIPLPASTQWDLINRSAPHLEPVFTELIRDAASGEVVYNDDTTMRVLERMAERKQKSEGGERTGTFTTGIISTTQERKIALYLTGGNHAGENMADVLAECDVPSEDPIIQMSDGLSLNEPTHLPEGLEVIHASCMAHGRRKYVEIADSFPEQCLYVIGALEFVYKADAHARKAKLSPAERMAHHQQRSDPVMRELKVWLQRQIDEKLVEPNSAFGEATKYMLKRWDKLTRFLTVPGAPLDNNICERALKRAIRHRKNSLFYKTLHGARVGDIYMSLIHTCELNGINAFDYLTALVRQGDRLAEEPERWLPWHYAANHATPGDSAAA